ncbi:hypothetical protein [Luteimicrobium subarcticum]|uniref:Peptide chain release factor 1 n=1 Tax=Luteimicrobium subarcticum TaxID=620910 RepID=A0A2M8WU59_9MICO|nr:hypothetical protein [Luteimicrobium subarcticum]PJI94472.1 hypothetical protein CLV34_0308 [Luteimicrobium subarcticum]
MKIDWLRPLLGEPGPFATVYLDATPSRESTDREIGSRWRSVRRSLESQGAPPGLCDTLEEALRSSARGVGVHGRVLVATEEAGILVDRVLSEPPAVQHGEYGPVPYLIQAARAADETVDHLVVTVDRQGADLTWSVGGERANQPEPLTVEGGHDDITKVKTGSLNDRRLDARAEDSWERNAEAVAAEVDRQVAEHRPELVVLTGEGRSVGLVRGALSKRSVDLLVEVPGGSRSAGAKDSVFAQRLADEVEACRARRRAVVVDAYREGQGRADGSVTALADVVTVLQRGQVRELILSDELRSGSEIDGTEVWVGPEPLQIGSDRASVVALGADDGVHPLPASVALVRAALGQDAGLTFVPAGSVELVDGVGALLRWTDAGTPSESAPTMSGDQRRLRDVV